MIRDRGLKKWQGFFMTEHTDLLKNYSADDYKTKKPILDEQELEEINIVIYDSLNYTLPIKVTTWKDGFFKHHKGVVDKVDPISMSLAIETETGWERILIKDITAVERI